MSDDKFANRLFIAAAGFLVFVLIWLVVWALTAEPVHAETLRFQWVPPTVSGIEAAPAGDRYYQPQRTVRQAPSAVVLDLYEPAPPNGCEPPAFRVISGPLSDRGCRGTR